MNNLSKILKKQIEWGFWPGFVMAMYPSQFTYEKVDIDVQDIWKNTTDINLYYHIPFCKWKCPYCGFFSVLQKDDEFMHRYVYKMIEQVKYYNSAFQKKVNIKSICFGGGTPNYLPIQYYYEIFNNLSNMNVSFSSELEPSMEISPEIIDENYVRQLKDIGIKRLSLGVQSLDENIRTSINRSNNYSLIQMVELLRKYDMRINIDIINGLEGQTPELFMSTLLEILAFKPENISIYPLAGKNSSVFKRDKNIMTSKEKYMLFNEYYDYLTSNGYDCESHVKFVRSDQSSTHQQKIYEYQGVETLGLGCAARSYNRFYHYSLESQFNMKTTNRIELLDHFLKTPFDEYIWYGIKIDEVEQKCRYVIYSFLVKQLEGQKYYDLFGTKFTDDFEEEIKAVIDNGLINQTSDDLFEITKKGRTYTDLLCMQFWSDKVKQIYDAKRGILL